VKIPSSLSLPEIQQSFREAIAVLDLLTTKNIDLHGRRVINAGESKGKTDYITQREVLGLLSQISTSSNNQTPITISSSGVAVGPYSSRPAATANMNAIFSANDRNYVTWISNGTAWYYIAGTQVGTISPDQRPTLSSEDSGYRFFGSDDLNEYVWNGIAWKSPIPDASSTARGAVTTGTQSFAGSKTFISTILSLTGMEVLKDGSDTFAGGAFLGTSNTANNIVWLIQLSSSNNLDFWFYNGSPTKLFTLSYSGNITLAAANATVDGVDVSAHTHTGASGDAPKITEAGISLSNVSTDDVSITAHGFCPLAPNSTTQWLRGDATWQTIPVAAVTGAAAAASITAHTIPLAKLTSGGTNGSITVNAQGIVTGYVDPT
jgi:hypothetical protein